MKPFSRICQCAQSRGSHWLWGRERESTFPDISALLRHHDHTSTILYSYTMIIIEYCWSATYNNNKKTIYINRKCAQYKEDFPFFSLGATSWCVSPAWFLSQSGLVSRGHTRSRPWYHIYIHIRKTIYAILFVYLHNYCPASLNNVYKNTPRTT